MKLNRHISIILAVLILASNIGLAFNVHYCGESISSVSLAYELNEPDNNHHKEAEKDNHNHKKTGMACCSASDADHGSCCDDDIVKLDDNGEAKVIVKSLQLELGTLCTGTDWSPIPSYLGKDIVIKDIPSFYCESNAPPLFKLYCKYILYA